jgi:hypothetical protein
VWAERLCPLSNPFVLSLAFWPRNQLGDGLDMANQNLRIPDVLMGFLASVSVRMSLESMARATKRASLTLHAISKTIGKTIQISFAAAPVQYQPERNDNKLARDRVDSRTRYPNSNPKMTPYRTASPTSERDNHNKCSQPKITTI